MAEYWDLTKESAHPKAVELLTEEFFWCGIDGNSPLGNDTGADVLQFFYEWRRSNITTPCMEFLNEILRKWQVDTKGWDVVDPEVIKANLALHHIAPIAMSIHDDTTIAAAFAQLVLEGSIDPEVKVRAVTAVTRQSLDVVIKDRGWRNPDERKVRLSQMKRVLIFV